MRLIMNVPWTIMSLMTSAKSSGTCAITPFCLILHKPGGWLHYATVGCAVQLTHLAFSAGYSSKAPWWVAVEKCFLCYALTFEGFLYRWHAFNSPSHRPHTNIFRVFLDFLSAEDLQCFFDIACFSSRHSSRETRICTCVIMCLLKSLLFNI